MGRLAVDAVPWATLTAITGPDGQPVPLPTDAVTPLVLELSEGSYTLELKDATGAVRRQPALVTRQQRAAMRVEFPRPAAEEYLKDAGF